MTSSSFRYFSNPKNNVRSSTFESNGEISRNGGGVTGIGGGRDYGQLENLWFGHIDFGAKTDEFSTTGFAVNDFSRQNNFPRELYRFPS